MRGFLRARSYACRCAQVGFKSPENNPDGTKSSQEHVKNIFKLKPLELLKRGESKQFITFIISATISDFRYILWES